MNIIVSKFGGSSTACSDSFRRILEIIQSSQNRRFLILSAPGKCEDFPEKVTDLLCDCWNASAKKEDFSIPLEKIIFRFKKIAQELSIEGDIPEMVRAEILNALHISKDHTLSRGEYLCARLFSIWSQIPFSDSKDLVCFYPDGRLNPQDTLNNFARLSEETDRAIIPGFYGALPDGCIHTFPRNGSDISGALAAAAMHATVYENWSDVDGFMTADPSIVEFPQLNPHVGYSQMLSLSKEGAQVLHPDCLKYVLPDIPIHLLNTFNTNSKGTLVSGDYTDIAPCVTGKDDYALLFSENLTCAAKHLLTLPYRRFVTADKRDIFLIKNTVNAFLPEGCLHVACICIFCKKPSVKANIIMRIPHLFQIDERDHFKIIVPSKAFRETIRLIHTCLIQQ